MKAWVPGAGGNPEAVLNTDAFCDELNVSGVHFDGAYGAKSSRCRLSARPESHT
jgi:hypothetical protein